VRHEDDKRKTVQELGVYMYKRKTVLKSRMDLRWG
jgi:hypothetical protein